MKLNEKNRLWIAMVLLMLAGVFICLAVPIFYGLIESLQGLNMKGLLILVSAFAAVPAILSLWIVLKCLVFLVSWLHRNRIPSRAFSCLLWVVKLPFRALRKCAIVLRPFERNPAKTAVSALFVLCVCVLVRYSYLEMIIGYLQTTRVEDRGVPIEKIPVWITSLSALTKAYLNSVLWPRVIQKDLSFYAQLVAGGLLLLWGWQIFRMSVTCLKKRIPLFVVWSAGVGAECYFGLYLLWYLPWYWIDRADDFCYLTDQETLVYLLIFAVAFLVSVVIPALVTRSFRALKWGALMLASFALFALGYLAVAPHFFGIGLIVFLIAAVEYVRALPFGDRLGRWRHWPVVVYLVYGVIGSGLHGYMEHRLNKLPYNEKISLGEKKVIDIQHFDYPGPSWMTHWGHWTRGENVQNWSDWCFSILKEGRRRYNLTDDWLDVILCADASLPSLTESLDELLSSRVAEMPCLTNVVDMIEIAKTRARRNCYIETTGYRALYNVRQINDGLRIFPEIAILAILTETDIEMRKYYVEGLLRFMDEVAKERNSYGNTSAEYACLSGLRYLLMRHLSELSVQEIASVRAAICSQAENYPRKRIELLARAIWVSPRQFDLWKSSGPMMLSALMDCRFLENALFYEHHNLFTSRIKMLVKEWNDAEKEGRQPDFGKPLINVEAEVTLIADAYTAVDLVLAVEQYRRAKGALPESLENLVPEFLPKVPVSVTEGTPYVYEKGLLSFLEDERCPEELEKYRMKDLADRPVDHFAGLRVSFNYSNLRRDKENYKQHCFSLPVLDTQKPAANN